MVQGGPLKKKEKKKARGQGQGQAPNRTSKVSRGQKPHDEKRQEAKEEEEEEEEEGGRGSVDLASTIPITLQQLLLNVFKGALLGSPPLDTKTLIQTIKTHLYNRDFDAAFTDANEELLRAYALRWSASRALGYAGVFKATLRLVLEQSSASSSNHVVCIGGGAGAEIVALAAVWREMIDEQNSNEERGLSPPLSVTAVDIADWSSVVNRLATALTSSSIVGSRTHPAPLLPTTTSLNVTFQRTDVLRISDGDLSGLLREESTALVTLMFTLNELFSTSMAKTTSFLLRMTDLLAPGTVLLVVDSPGSYSTLNMKKPSQPSHQEDSTVSERRYPMKFLLDHTLLSVAEGKWDRVCSQDSRWWRRDAARLGYDVGEGAGLEDMRFQIHIYRRI
ncbi:hypothetical protein ASPZODRAFT_89642 [Penicilliopsis zonata CBS 506.65]|uniref:25S rRNA (Uridine(2843)-N(3))-methyltransferase n=1 Tax=Penicilliopsis zonata CBS 506.65 TaxID=1073090 RepID=A0A1L9SRZ3_9EURO|nr:hypothetical protein ASPZODRAFT_89642 [Penicilliopsis zonata CBS 506.65]OJJ49958.1 hypothetical protein ASPZODRAFT_89642 [Penicilliopsis zonata CBS 506.65]